MPSSKASRDRAEAQFDKKLQAQKAGAKAMSEYEAAGQAVRERTVRLRALRLAKEAAEKGTAEEPAATPTPVKKKSAKASGKAGGKAGEKALLADWLTTQRAQGRRS